MTLAVIKAVKEAVGEAPIGIRISQGKVNDYAHKWAEGEKAAETVFGSLNDAGVDVIHVTEHDALKPAFTAGGASLLSLARRYAPGVTTIANGGLDTPERVSRALEQGADIIAIGKASLANPDLPERFARSAALTEFDPSVLQPIANIKNNELMMA